MNRQMMLSLFPGIARMSSEELAVLQIDSAMVEAARMEGNAAPGADGTNPNITLQGWAVVAKDPVKKFVKRIAPLTGLSTTFSQEFEVAGNPKVLPRMEVTIVDDSGSAEMDNFGSLLERDSAAASSAEVQLHFFNDVFRVYGRDIERGVDVQPQLEACMNRVANKMLKYFYSQVRVGAAQGDDASVLVQPLEIPSLDDGFGFAYANRKLTEAIQPRVHALVLKPEYYGELKAADKDGYKPDELDTDLVCKSDFLEECGDGCVGLAVNKRGAGVGMKAPYRMQGAYASIQQVQHEGIGFPLTVSTFFSSEYNCMVVEVATYMGVTVTDATAIKPLVAAAAVESPAESAGEA